VMCFAFFFLLRTSAIIRCVVLNLAARPIQAHVQHHHVEIACLLAAYTISSEPDFLRGCSCELDVCNELLAF